jgi:hypothetical protein
MLPIIKSHFYPQRKTAGEVFPHHLLAAEMCTAGSEREQVVNYNV